MKKKSTKSTNKKRKQQSNSNLPSPKRNRVQNSPSIELSKSIEPSQQELQQLVNEARKSNQRNVNKQTKCLIPNICVICDKYIIGYSECMNYLSKEEIMRSSKRLDVAKWKAVAKRQHLDPELKKQYTVEDPDLDGILLSPCAPFNNTKGYMCCLSCKKSLLAGKKSDNSGSPPKFAFANGGFLIGYLPENAWKYQPDVSFCEVLTQIIAPSQPFYFVYSMLGGKSKKNKGTVHFFQSINSN